MSMSKKDSEYLYNSALWKAIAKDNEPINYFADPNLKSYLSNSLIVTDKTDPTIINEHNKSLIELKKKDFDWKIKARPWYGGLLLGFLLIQTIVVFHLTYWGASQDNTQVYWLLTVIVPATLLQTAYMVTVIIKWLFNDINYEMLKR
jgi:hypothetical protein